MKIKNLLFAFVAAIAFSVPLHAQVNLSNTNLSKDEVKRLSDALGKNVDIPSSATPTINTDNGAMFSTTLTANATVAIMGKHVVGRHIYVRVRQDATGSRTVTWPASVRWSGGTAPTLTTTAGKTDVFEFLDTGTYYLGKTYALNYTES